MLYLEWLWIRILDLRQGQRKPVKAGINEVLHADGGVILAVSANLGTNFMKPLFALTKVNLSYIIMQKSHLNLLIVIFFI